MTGAPSSFLLVFLIFTWNGTSSDFHFARMLAARVWVIESSINLLTANHLARPGLWRCQPSVLGGHGLKTAQFTYAKNQKTISNSII